MILIWYYILCNYLYNFIKYWNNFFPEYKTDIPIFGKFSLLFIFLNMLNVDDFIALFFFFIINRTSTESILSNSTVTTNNNQPLDNSSEDSNAWVWIVTSIGVLAIISIPVSLVCFRLKIKGLCIIAMYFFTLIYRLFMFWEATYFCNSVIISIYEEKYPYFVCVFRYLKAIKFGNENDR